MLEIRNLALSYGSKAVLSDCSFSCLPNKIYGLIGLNGSGKSSLFNCLYGFTSKTNGQILYNGGLLNHQNIAYLETQNFFYSYITGQEYLELFPKNNQSLVAEYVQKFQLPLSKLIDTYSTGMKKKLAILGFLHLNKPILLIDEPFNGLDLEANYHLEKLILELRASNRTIIVTSHILETLFPVCDEILWLDQGKIANSFHQNDFGLIKKEIFL